MARPPTGQIIERRGKDGRRTFGIRFRAHGQRHYVTTTASTREEAHVELKNVLADVRRGFWRAPITEQLEAPKEQPTFHTFASEWIAARELEGLAEKTITDLRWSLSNHLLPYFADCRLSEITPQEVDRFKVAKARERQELQEARARGEKVRERGLSNGSINHVLSDLAQVLETALDYGWIEQNPASGKRRRLTATTPARPWVEPEQLPALLDAAPAGVGRVLLAVLAGAGLRIGEALALRWRHVDLMGAGTLSIVGSKTEAGVRSVDLPVTLREELRKWWHESQFDRPDNYVLPSSTGNKNNPSNLRRDVLAPTIERANEELEKDGIAPIAHVTFHSLRRTFASLRCACGDDVAQTSAQIGHTDPRFTLRVYTQATKRRERLSGPHLRAYDRAIEWARMGTNEAEVPASVTQKATKTPA